MAWLTVQEAADLLRVPVSWLYERTRTNSVPHVKLGKYLRFDRDELAPGSMSSGAMGAVRERSGEQHGPPSVPSSVDFFGRISYLLPPCNPD